MAPTPGDLLEKRAAKLRKKLSGKKTKKKTEDSKDGKKADEEASPAEEKLSRENVNQPGPDGAIHMH